MDTDPGETPGEGTGIDHGGEAAGQAELSRAGVSANPTAETERMVGQILDDGLAATGYVPGNAGGGDESETAGGQQGVGQGAGSAATAATDRALFVLRTLDDIAAPVPTGFGTQPMPPPPDVATVDGLLDFQGIDLDAPNAQLPRPAPGSSYRVRHRYNEAQVGVTIVALAAFLGAILFLSGSTASPSASPAASGAAVVAGPSGAATPVSTLPTPNPSPEPSPAATDPATPPPTTAPTGAPPTPVAQSVTLRGPIDVRPMKKVGLEVGAHEVELLVFQDNGDVTGTFTIALETFPIGSLLAATFDEAGNPKWAAFEKCTVRLVLEGDAKGRYDPGTGKLKGTARFRPVVEDPRDCLKTRPSNVTIDPTDVAKPKTVKWSATFDGKQAKGRVGLDPALSFAATPEG